MNNKKSMVFSKHKKYYQGAIICALLSFLFLATSSTFVQQKNINTQANYSEHEIKQLEALLQQVQYNKDTTAQVTLFDHIDEVLLDSLPHFQFTDTKEGRRLSTIQLQFADSLILTGNIELHNFAYLTSINMHGQSLTDLYIFHCPLLQDVNCSRNRLSNIRIELCNNIDRLDLSENGLTQIDLRNCQKIKHLDLSWNCLSLLDLSELSALENLQCYRNEWSTPKIESYRYILRIVGACYREIFL